MRLAFAVAALCACAAIGAGQSTIEDYQEMLKANPKSSLAHYGIGDIYLQRHSWQAAASEFRLALIGDLQPKWTEVWSHIGCGKAFDASGQPERAINEYKLAIRTNDDTRGALAEARRQLESPYKP